MVKATVEFEIDLATGNLTAHIKGIKGKRCADIQQAIEALTGAASEVKLTEEWYTDAPSQVVVHR